MSHVAHWWSPDGLRLAYATIDDTLVPKMEMPLFTGGLYPGAQEYRYPKVSLLSFTRTHVRTIGVENSLPGKQKALTVNTGGS